MSFSQQDMKDIEMIIFIAIIYPIIEWILQRPKDSHLLMDKFSGSHSITVKDRTEKNHLNPSFFQIKLIIKNVQLYSLFVHLLVIIPLIVI